MNLPEIREGIANLIKQATRVNTYPYPVATPQFPCLVVSAGSPYIESPDTFGRELRVSFELVAGEAAGAGDAQRFLDELLAQIYDAVEDDRVAGMSLGGLVDDLTVTGGDLAPEGDPNERLFVASVRVSALLTRS